MQSVLVTIDRHEWYAHPQIYTRDDNTGLWMASRAIHTEFPLLSSTTNCIQKDTGSVTLMPTAEFDVLEHSHQDSTENGIDGSSKMEADDENVIETSNIDENSLSEKKRRRIEEDSIVEKRIFFNETLDEDKDQALQHQTDLENVEVLQNHAVTQTNASLAEEVIEPALVMFEVCFLFCAFCLSLVL